jgi:hypothetical protein
MTHTKSQRTTRPTNPSLTGPGDPTREGHYQPMQMHLSAKPPVKSNFSTHLGITIRWGGPPPCYLPVAGGGGTPDGRTGGASRVGDGSC